MTTPTGTPPTLGAPPRSTNGRRDVLKPGSRTVQSDPDRPSRQPLDGPRRIHWGWEIARIFFGLLGLLLALIVVATCVGVVVVGDKMMDVLKDISKHDYSEASQRFERYSARFDAMTAARCKVDRSEPKIREGITSYLYMVQPPGSDDRIIYRWKHDLNLNKVDPMSNAALLMDIQLGYIKAGDAASYNFYNPNDKLAQALAKADFTQIGPETLRGRPGNSGLPQGPVLPPKVTPEQARARAHTEPAVDPNKPPEIVNDDQAGDATDVSSGDTPPAEGDSSDVKGKDDKDKDGKDKKDKKDPPPPPPDNDAVPVG